MGKCKFFCLKFADDGVIVADLPEGLRKMLGQLKKFSEESGMEVNEKKTKIMIFKRGGRAGWDRWKCKGWELEVVNEYK